MQTAALDHQQKQTNNYNSFLISLLLAKSHLKYEKKESRITSL